MSKKLATGYKVIKRNGRGSAIYTDLGIVYNRQRRTVPLKHYGPLAVFIGYDYARNFVSEMPRRNSYYKIVKCKYKKSKHKALWIEYAGPGSMIGELPTGTDFADWVTCLE